MKIRKAIWALSGAILVAATTPMFLGQARGGPMNGRGWGEMRGGPGFLAPVTGAPYTAVCTTTHVQTLANGTTISHANTVKEARDAEGRAWREETFEHDGKSFVSTQVFDPVSHVAISWNSNSQKANLVHLPDRSQFDHARGTGEGTDRPVDFHRTGPKPSVEQLGSKTIGGVNAVGTRTSFVIAAGKEGNSQPLTITHESWRSSDLKIEVMLVDSDPRTGTTTMELSNIDRNDPPATLFQAPEGYTVQEHSRGQFSSRVPGGPEGFR